MKILLYLVPDLMFATRIEDAAHHLGYRAQSVTRDTDFEAVISDTHPDMVVLTFDRNVILVHGEGRPGAGPQTTDDSAPDAWERLASAAKRAGLPVLAFGSHVDAASFKRARELGCDQVVPRSKMSADLPGLLKALPGGH